jgi:hypothetical protein
MSRMISSLSSSFSSHSVSNIKRSLPNSLASPLWLFLCPKFAYKSRVIIDFTWNHARPASALDLPTHQNGN